MLRTEKSQNVIAVRALWVYSAALVILLFRFLSEAMCTQLSRPILFSNETEFVYRVFVQSGLPQCLTGNAFASVLFDTLLFSLPLLLLLNFSRWMAVLFSVLVLVYMFTFNVVTGHHYHGLVGLLVISIPFFFKDENKFLLAWEGARYYLLYLFVSAALWKIMRGSIFHTEQLSNILKSQQLDFLLQNTGSLKHSIISYLIAHPKSSHILNLTNVLLQLSFLVGFFTRRWDTILLFLAIAFTLVNYLVMGIASFELLILGITLLKFPDIRSSN